MSPAEHFILRESGGFSTLELYCYEHIGPMLNHFGEVLQTGTIEDLIGASNE